MPREPWPDNGIDFNRWYYDLPRLIAALDDAKDLRWWGVDSELKYLVIRVDTRGTAFTLRNRSGEIIDPNRVLEAIEKYRTRFNAA